MKLVINQIKPCIDKERGLEANISMDKKPDLEYIKKKLNNFENIRLSKKLDAIRIENDVSIIIFGNGKIIIRADNEEEILKYMKKLRYIC